MTAVGTQRGSAVRVLIAEDLYLAREGTQRLLDDRPEVEVVGTAADYDGVLDGFRALHPDVVLMDIKMPPTHSMEGIDAARVIKSESPDTGVLILSQHDDESYVWAALADGVSGLGYLHKVRVGDLDRLVRALVEVASGGSVIDPRIVETLVRHRAGKRGSPLGQLTAGELDTLRSMAEGKSNQAIATEGRVAVGTVEKRIAAVFTKLGLQAEADLNRRVAAVLIYLRESASTA